MPTIKNDVVKLKFVPANEAEIKSLGLDDLPEGYVAGWASKSNEDAYGHIVDPNAFTGSIKTRGLTGPKSVKLLLNHDTETPAGVIKKLEPRSNGIWIEAQLALNVSYVKDFYEIAKMAGGYNFSVGFRRLQSRVELIDTDGDGDFDERIEYITEGDLLEVSLVPIPANEECGMTVIKSRQTVIENPKTIAELEKRIISLGLVPSRNKARSLIQEIKANITLFDGKAAAPVAPPKPTRSPMLVKMKNAAISDRIARLKETLV